VAEALARKESSDCAWCGAKLRARRIARVILEVYSPGQRLRSLADWVATEAARRLKVAEINKVEGLHDLLRELPLLVYSDFDDPATRSGTAPSAPSEDLTGLSYPDAAFDLVVTSETLEHVPDLSRALAEIRRVLVPGTGLHVFTVPLLPSVPRTYSRASVRPDGTVEYLAPEIRHPGGDVGYPVFTEFGADFREVLEQAGFEVRECFGPVREDDVAQVWVARRRD
jgi:SAM-dependent methyltransferase